MLLRPYVSVFLILLLTGCGGGRVALPPTSESSTALHAFAPHASSTRSLFAMIDYRIGTYLALYNEPFKGGPPSATLGYNAYPQLALDEAGDLFTLKPGGTPPIGTLILNKFARPYTGSPQSVTLLGFTPWNFGGLAIHASKYAFVSDPPDNKIAIFAAPYTAAPVSTITHGLNSPHWLAFDGYGNLFVENVGNNTITEYAPPYTGTPKRTISKPISAQHEFAVDTFGNLFGIDGATVKEYQPPYTGFPVKTITAGLDRPLGLTLDQGNHLFVVNHATVTEYLPPSYTTYRTVITFTPRPSGSDVEELDGAIAAF